MENKVTNHKPANRWLDIQVVIATLAMTFVLALWNMFAGTDRISNNNSSANSRTRTTISSSSVSSTSSVPGTILLGGSAPSAAPRPLTVTSSSRP